MASMLIDQMGDTTGRGGARQTDATRRDQARRLLRGMTPGESPSTDELEGRLGRMCDGRFVPGVSSVWFQTLAVRLERYPGWAHQSQWVEIEDTFFSHDGRDFRQSRTCNAVTCRVDLSTIQKTRGPSRVILTEQLALVQNDILPTDVTALRISQATETECDCQHLPPIVTPTYVRIKQRKTFRLNSQRCSGGGWKFELTRSWAGRNREEAELCQRSSDPVNEVEVEWLPPPDATPGSDEYERLLVSLVEKLCSLLV